MRLDENLLINTKLHVCWLSCQTVDEQLLSHRFTFNPLYWYNHIIINDKVAAPNIQLYSVVEIEALPLNLGPYFSSAMQMGYLNAAFVEFQWFQAHDKSSIRWHRHNFCRINPEKLFVLRGKSTQKKIMFAVTFGWFLYTAIIVEQIKVHTMT